MTALKAYTADDTIVDVDALYFDGYAFGERMLEGAVFKVTLENDDLKVTCETTLPKFYKEKAILEEALAFARDHDVFSTTPDLDNDDGFIETQNPTQAGAPKQIKIMSGSDLIAMLKG